MAATKPPSHRGDPKRYVHLCGTSFKLHLDFAPDSAGAEMADKVIAAAVREYERLVNITQKSVGENALASARRHIKKEPGRRTLVARGFGDYSHEEWS